MIHATRPFVLNEWIQTKIDGYEVSGTVEVCLFTSPALTEYVDKEQKENHINLVSEFLFKFWLFVLSDMSFPNASTLVGGRQPSSEVMTVRQSIFQITNSLLVS